MSYGPIVDKIAGAISPPNQQKPTIAVAPVTAPSLFGQGSAAKKDSSDKAARNANNPWASGG